MKAHGAMLAVVLLCLSLAGCMYVTADPPGLTVARAVDSVLKGGEEVGNRSVDFDKIVSGNWDHLVVACAGTSPKLLEDALGFDWKPSRELFRSDFLAMLIFVEDGAVADYIDVGVDDFANEVYFIPCPLAVGGKPDVVPPISLERGEATIDFAYSRPNGYWYLPIDVYRALLER